MAPNYLQYPYQTCYPPTFTPYTGQQGFQTAVPMQSQQPQRPSLLGRKVNKLEDIAPNDVPMDGSSGYFPLTDDNAIIVKSWNSDGTIKTTKYVPEQIDISPEKPKPMTLYDLQEWLDGKFAQLSPKEEEVAKG